MHVHCLLGLKNMTMYERAKPATAGPVADTYLELKMLCLFYFVLESETNSHNVGVAVVPEKRFYFPLYIFFLFLISISNVKYSLTLNKICLMSYQFIPQFINVIAPNNDLLMDKLNVIYVAPKWWLYVMIWLPLTTDNLTYFAQSLEIRGIESRLYIS